MSTVVSCALLLVPVVQVSEQLDVGAAGLEQMQLVLPTSGCILAQVQLIRLSSQAAVPSQKAANASRSAWVNTGTMGTRAADGIVVAIGTSGDSR